MAQYIVALLADETLNVTASGPYHSRVKAQKIADAIDASLDEISEDGIHDMDTVLQVVELVPAEQLQRAALR